MDLVRASRIMPVIIATSARRATINSPNVYVSKPRSVSIRNEFRYIT